MTMHFGAGKNKHDISNFQKKISTSMILNVRNCIPLMIIKLRI